MNSLNSISSSRASSGREWMKEATAVSALWMKCGEICARRALSSARARRSPCAST